MLFNSFSFIFLFVPVTVTGFFFLARHSHERAISWLALASLFFYAIWNPPYLLLILASMMFNLLLGRWVARKRGTRAAKWLLAVGVSVNLLLLAYFKYAAFLVQTAAALTNASWAAPDIVLPLAISFFTFQQIAFLVDARNGEFDGVPLRRYMLFVSFFPQLIAGPILRPKEILPDLDRKDIWQPRWDRFAAGGTLFVIGLFKKTILADGIAPYANPVFDLATEGVALTLFEAWFGVLAYAFQIYFDFSGYSDMAIALGALFGLRIPINFDSPYKALNITDFWRRWHITLSRFLRDYLYIPLGGNRKGPVRRYANLLVTMLLGGLWHGAGWTFVMWGALHGMYLVVNHAWTGLKARAGWTGPSTVASRFSARTVTFVAVCVAWVFFRADSFGAAWGLLQGMVGMNGVSFPSTLAVSAPAWMADMGVLFKGMTVTGLVQTVGWCALLAAVAFWAPNSNEILAGLGQAECPRRQVKWEWKPSFVWAGALGIAMGIAVLGLTQKSEFLYFQF